MDTIETGNKGATIGAKAGMVVAKVVNTSKRVASVPIRFVRDNREGLIFMTGVVATVFLAKAASIGAQKMMGVQDQNLNT